MKLCRIQTKLRESPQMTGTIIEAAVIFDLRSMVKICLRGSRCDYTIME